MIFKINEHEIGVERPCYIIAEISANHSHNFEKAVSMIKTAKDVGADAVKIQTYTPDTLTINCDNEYFRIGKGTIWEGRTLYELYGEAYTPWEWQPELKTVADKIGITLFSTPFDASAVDFLEKMDVPAYKIASFELIDLPLIEKVARTGKPLIISTGMASEDEIAETVDLVAGYGNGLVLLKCCSAYPARPEDMNLRAIPYMAKKFNVPAGLSDHTLENTVPAAAVALGACVIEKHFTLSRKDGGPDSNFSLEPDEFKLMVDTVRTVEKALGETEIKITEHEKASLVFRRSLFVVRDIKKGEKFTLKNVRDIRPGNGLPPKYLKKIIGMKASRDIARGTPLEPGIVEGL
jgi:pseudaminic acid synthase